MSVTGGYPNDPLYTQGLLRETFASPIYQKIYPVAEFDFAQYKERNHCPNLIETFQSSVWLNSTGMFLGRRQDMQDIVDAVSFYWSQTRVFRHREFPASRDCCWQRR